LDFDFDFDFGSGVDCLMCGRYTLTANPEALARAFLAEFGEEVRLSLKPRYNIAPGGGVVAVLEDRDKGGRRGEVLQWGLVPSWAKDPSISHKLINARAETVGRKPSFSDAFRYRRCLVPMTGFYEWDRSKRPRQPYYFYHDTRPLMAVAGVWEYWLHPSGSEIYSVALLTREADSVVGKIHHRMPVILPESCWSDWLDPERVLPAEIAPFPGRAEVNRLRSHPVTLDANRTGRDDPGLIEPVEPRGTSEQLDLF
jgi:putative SOS response-associated peptidase YedK